jgi:hypothetical protein
VAQLQLRFKEVRLEPIDGFRRQTTSTEDPGGRQERLRGSDSFKPPTGGTRREAIESHVQSSMIVFEFKHFATALACYRSPEYFVGR